MGRDGEARYQHERSDSETRKARLEEGQWGGGGLRFSYHAH